MIKTFKDFNSKGPINLDKKGIVFGFDREQFPLNLDDHDFEFGIGDKNARLHESGKIYKEPSGLITDQRKSFDAAYGLDHDKIREQSQQHDFDNEHVATHPSRQLLRDYSSHSRLLNERLKGKTNIPFHTSRVDEKEHTETLSAARDSMRELGATNHGVLQATRHIDSTMTPTKKPHTVFSGVTGEDIHTIKKDRPFHTGRYVSTTIAPHVAKGFSYGKEKHVLKIALPAGHPHVWMGSLGDPQEKEIVLPRHTLFRHTGKVDTHFHGKDNSEHVVRVHHVEAIHPDDHHKYGHTAFHGKDENGN